MTSIAIDEIGIKTSEQTAVGKDSYNTFKRFVDIVVGYYEPISREDYNIIKKFHSLRLTWQHDTKYASFALDMVLHPAYLEIIGMGRVVIPLILNELKREPHHWFWALSSLTGENPIRQEQRGKMHEMIKAWLVWGKEHNYIV